MRHLPMAIAGATRQEEIWDVDLLTQAEQVACFRNAARHLGPGGRFVIELWVPELRELPPGQQATVWHCEPACFARPSGL